MATATDRTAQREAMNKMTVFFSCIATAGAVLTTPADAGLAFHVDVDTHSEPVAGRAGTAPPDTHSAFDATLTDQTMVIESERATTFYDFRNRRRTVIDKATRTRIDYSLYDVVALRVLELHNREALGGALAAAKVDGRMGKVDNEHNLGIQDQPSSPLRSSDDADGRTFSDGPRVFYHQGIAATVVKPDEARWFCRFLRLSAFIHPQIVAAIGASNAIASDFVVISYDVTQRTTTYRVRSVRAVPDAPFDVMAYPSRPVTSTGDAIDRSLDRAALVTAADVEHAKQRNTEALVAANREGRALDILLGTVERALMTGETGMPFTASQIQLLQADLVGLRVRGALAASTRAELIAAVEVLVQARASTTTNVHVLKIFEANDRAKLGDTKTALALFAEVLAVDPAIASAYKDLGDVLLVGYDTPRAWRSWDAGRRIGPGVTTFSAVDQFEQSLAKRHPEFF